CAEAGRPQRWLSIPLILTSHTWENGKNEQSHQDPSMAKALLGEPSHVSRVVFPADFNTAAAVTEHLSRTQGQIWAIVAPKVDTVPDLFTPEEARRLVEAGGTRLNWRGRDPERARILVTAVGAYQLTEAIRASRWLSDRDIPHAVIYLLEPGRFRAARNRREQAHQASASLIDWLYPAAVQPRLFLTHTRPETLLGVLGPLHTGPHTSGLGYINEGGTLTRRACCSSTVARGRTRCSKRRACWSCPASGSYPPKSWRRWTGGAVPTASSFRMFPRDFNGIVPPRAHRGMLDTAARSRPRAAEPAVQGSRTDHA